MIAIDTNVLVRLLTRDDEPQSRQASALFTKNKIFIPETVILETEWVLRFADKLPQAAILEALRKTLVALSIGDLRKSPRPCRSGTGSRCKVPLDSGGSVLAVGG